MVPDYSPVPTDRAPRPALRQKGIHHPERINLSLSPLQCWMTKVALDPEYISVAGRLQQSQSLGEPGSCAVLRCHRFQVQHSMTIAVFRGLLLSFLRQPLKAKRGERFLSVWGKVKEVHRKHGLEIQYQPLPQVKFTYKYFVSYTILTKTWYKITFRLCAYGVYET